MGRDEGRGDVTGWESVNQEPRVSTHTHTHTHNTYTHGHDLSVCLSSGAENDSGGSSPGPPPLTRSLDVT